MGFDLNENPYQLFQMQALHSQKKENEEFNNSKAANENTKSRKDL